VVQVNYLFCFYLAAALQLRFYIFIYFIIHLVSNFFVFVYSFYILIYFSFILLFVGQKVTKSLCSSKNYTDDCIKFV